MEKKVNTEWMLQGSIVKAILSLSVPVIMNSFLQTMYNLTDTYWMGKMGTIELAAINLITPVQNMIINFGSGITVAGSVLVAQYVGAKKTEDAKAMANQIFVCAIAFALICSAICWSQAGAISAWLGADGATLEYSKLFLQLVIWDIAFLYTINIYAGLSQAQGDTLRPMLLNAFGIVINMICAPLFMFTFGWGVAGAALATLFAKVMAAVIAFVLLHSKKKPVYLNLKQLKFEKEKLKKIAVIGLPTAVGGSTMQFGFLLMSKNVFAYGTQAMAAYGIGNKVNGLISLPSNGIGSAVATIAGQNIGAGQTDRAQKGYRISRRMIVLFLFLGGLMLSRMPVSTAIVSIFSDDPQVILMAADFLSILSLYCWTNGIYNTTIGLFQGSAHTEVVMVVEVTRLWVFRFATLYVCEQLLHMGVRSIWYSVVVSNALATIMLYGAYRTNLWKKKRV